jgi:CubicO group peptidase (beta-lactamase class C family)
VVGLDDPIDWYLPDSVYSPTYRGRSIELWELATHTSGLPRAPTNIAPPDFADPYAAYTPDKLYAFLESYHLRRAPGAAYDYSNVGAGLLGYLLARRAGIPYAELLRERVLGPLELEETYVAPRDTVDDHLAQGYANGSPVEHWSFGALAGCGAVRSTAADLLRFLRDEIDPAGTPLADAIRLTQQVRFHVSNRLALGLAWHVNTLADGTPYYWHNGSTGGFRSFIGYSPVTRVGVVVLVNDAVPDHRVTRFGLRIGALAAVQ